MARCYDLSYVYDEIWMYECLMSPAIPDMPPKMHLNRYDGGTKVDGRGAAEWLDLRQKVMPKSWIKVHHADSHDSHEWRGLGVFRRDYFGLAQSRALFAYFCFVDGAVMNFTGGEKGSEDIYKDLIAKRKQYPALLNGECDYVAVQSDCRSLFAPLRRYGNQWMVPVINFSTEAADSSLCLANAGLESGREYSFTELYSQMRLSGGADTKLPVRLDGYTYALWLIEEA
ncbi:MAG: hypothetical protein PHO85_06500 [Candidatus Cloacimonetes bacterium]|nr:hypothetical protein [Candidatus Cloacimonadota bacterium]